MSTDPQTIVDALHAQVEEGESLYAILDAARAMEIAYRLQNSLVEHESLYRGRKEETLWHVAPYLVRCEREDEFFQWVVTEGWGDSWGIFLTSSANLEELRKHFRQFLMVTLEDGGEEKEVYFRFYDPRVLRNFLPTCTPDEATEFFGPSRRYLVEAEEPGTILNFTQSQQGAVQREPALSPHMYKSCH